MDLDPESEQIKEVYARFGLAVFMSQCLEHQLANSLLMLDLIPNNRAKAKSIQQWEETFDTFIESQFQKTLGKLIRSLQAVAPVQPELEGLLIKALERRNFLAHHYFRERAMEFMTNDGRVSMLSELEDAKDLFSKADRALIEVTKPVAIKYGINKELIEQCFQEMLDDASGSS